MRWCVLSVQVEMLIEMGMAGEHQYPLAALENVEEGSGFEYVENGIVAAGDATQRNVDGQDYQPVGGDGGEIGLEPGDLLGQKGSSILAPCARVAGSGVVDVVHHDEVNLPDVKGVVRRSEKPLVALERTLIVGTA